MGRGRRAQRPPARQQLRRGCQGSGSRAAHAHNGLGRCVDEALPGRCMRRRRPRAATQHTPAARARPTCQEAALLVLLLLALVCHERAVQRPLHRHQPRPSGRGQQLVLPPQGQLMPLPLRLSLEPPCSAARPQLLQPEAQLEQLVLPGGELLRVRVARPRSRWQLQLAAAAAPALQQLLGALHRLQ
jgi:hypothetical protein